MNEEEDLDDGFTDIEQKEAMSKQMTELLFKRVKKLGSTIKDYNAALGNDVDSISSTTYAEKTQNIEKHNAERKLIREKAALKIQTTTQVSFDSSDYLPDYSKPSRPIVEKHLFGDMFCSAVRSSTPSSGILPSFGPIRKSSNLLEAEKVKNNLLNGSRLSDTNGAQEEAIKVNNPRKTLISDAERQLQQISENNVTRLVEGLYSYFNIKPPKDGDNMYQERSVTENHEIEPESESTIMEKVTKNSSGNSSAENKAREDVSDLRICLLTEYTLGRLKIPQNENIENVFRIPFSSKLVARICEIIFGYVLRCKFSPFVSSVQMNTSIPSSKKEKILQQHRLREIEHVKKLLASYYVKLLRMLEKIKSSSKRDLCHKYLPYAVAHSIISGFKYLCPGSRHLYTEKFKHSVYLDCSLILLGVEVTSKTVTTISVLLFPEDNGLKDQALNFSNGWNNPDCFVVKESLSQFQPRIKFNAKKVGNLMENYISRNHKESNPLATEAEMINSDSSNYESKLDHELDSFELEALSCNIPEGNVNENHGLGRTYAPTPPHVINRTVPTAMCQSGGTDTFRASQARKYISENVVSDYKAALNKYHSMVRKSRKNLHKESLEIASKRESVLRGGMSHVGKFCLDLIQLRSEAASQPKFKRSNNKLDWHANLEANSDITQTADRIVAVKDAIDEARKKERRKARTKARMMLLHNYE